MAFRDRGLQRIGAAPPSERVRTGQGGASARDPAAIPQPAVLIREEHRIPVRIDPRREAGGGELHERQQRVHIGLSGQERGEHPGEPDRLAPQVRTQQVLPRGRRVRLVEHQVQHAEHGAEPRREILPRRHLERGLRRGERLLGAHDPLLHGRGRHEEGAGDLLGAETADHAQRERHTGLTRQHGVTGDEHEPQHVVVDRVRIPRRRIEGVVLLPREIVRDHREPVVVALSAPPAVDRAALGDRRQPRGGVRGDAILRPLRERFQERILGEVLREPEVAGVAGQGRDDARRLDAPHRGDGALHRGARRRRGIGSRHGPHSAARAAASSRQPASF